MLKRFVRIFGGDPNKRAIEQYSELVDEINSLEPQFEALKDEDLRQKTEEFKAHILESKQGLTDPEEIKRAEQAALEDILPEAFAVVREASKRTLGLRHYDVQLIGGSALHHGEIAEMRTGEGKTLVATLPLYLNALTGRGVHLITVNDYLARRDARWMAPIYNLLGLSVGVLQIAARTENGRKAFLVDLEKESPHEDQHQLRLVGRREAYEADITYGTNSEFGFDYLRDNMTMSLDERVQRGHYYAIVDEVDNVLIDEARTPLIISGPAQDDTEWYIRMAQIVKRLKPEDYEISERDRTVTLTEVGETHVEELLEMPLRDPERPEDVTPEQARLMGYLEQALRAQFLFKRNKDYLIQGGKVIIIDEFTGRLMPGRRWSDGLHQAVEAKEGVKVEAENVTYATITIQNYFRMYEKLAGMTGTAVTEAEEFDKIYKLDVLAIPTNLEYQAMRPESGLTELEDKDEQGYKYRFYAPQNDPQRKPVYWKRKDFPDVIYRTGEAKFRAVIKEILAYYSVGRPLLVGTTSVELSDRLSTRLRSEPLRRLAQVLLIRDAWMEQHQREEDGRMIPELQSLNAPLEQLQAPDLRKMATDLNLPLNPEEKSNLDRLVRILGLAESDEERLLSALKSGIPHQVLNARKHTEESQIIAGAGAFGAVTIATNMAGRGVDIKLGGELAEEIVSGVNRVLRKAGYEDPFDMTMEERRKALLAMNPEDYGIYDSEVNFFFQHMEDMERVKKLGGLHVIGSERHEARRIDNQLRGRSARQGDPGSSRFYLSLEDELMARFGGQQANDLMQRLRVDDALPIEVGLVGRIVEQSQTRVEGANFDVRKHLLEYDDVLNTQRQKIYEQRDRIFLKDDLSEDVTEMLRTEVMNRVPKALESDEGPWELLAWLDQVQPPFLADGQIFPSYTLKLLVDKMKTQLNGDGDRPAELATLLDVAEGSLRTEEEHLMRAVDTLLEQIYDRLEALIEERREALDTFFEGLELADETDTRQPRELVDELSGLMRFPVRLAPDQIRLLQSDPDQIKPLVRQQMEAVVNAQAAIRLVGAVERRFGESLELGTLQVNADNWDAVAEQVRNAAQALLARRRERYLGSNGNRNGQIARDLEIGLGREKQPLSAQDQQEIVRWFDSAIQPLGPEVEPTEIARLIQELRGQLAGLEKSLTPEDQEQIVEEIESGLVQVQGRLNEPVKSQLVQSLQEQLQEAAETVIERRLLDMLNLMPVGTQTSFDRKSHRRVTLRTVRLNYIFYAAHLLDNREPDEIARDVLDHLEEAQETMRLAWGRSEWRRLADTKPADMEERIRTGLRVALGEEVYQRIAGQPLNSLDAVLRQDVVYDLGRQALTEIYRQLLLGVITELWVDYLTQMEALRVSIGLEAYAQRDPLVQYKSKAFELFQTLVSNMRLGVVSRMFTYRPRLISSAPAARSERELETGAEEESSLPETEYLEAETQAEGVEAGDGYEPVSDEEDAQAPATAVAEKASQATAQPAPKQQSGKPSKSQKRRRSRH